MLTVPCDCLRLARRMVSKLSALVFVLLSVLPFTAPFSTIDPADFTGSRSADGRIRLLTTQTSDSIADDTAIIRDRSDFFGQSRQCGVATMASFDVIAAPPLVLPPIAAMTFTANLPALATVLRV
jgi:hypothetical protein